MEFGGEDENERRRRPAGLIAHQSCAMSFPPRLLVFALCAGVGYFGARAFTPAPHAVAATLPAPLLPVTGRESPALGLPPLTGAGSALVAEWEKLREEHGGAATDWAALFLDLKKMKDPFRRRAFQAALIAEWAAGDPRAALAFPSFPSSSLGMRVWAKLCFARRGFPRGRESGPRRPAGEAELRETRAFPSSRDCVKTLPLPEVRR